MARQFKKNPKKNVLTILYWAKTYARRPGDFEGFSECELKVENLVNQKVPHKTAVRALSNNGWDLQAALAAVCPRSSS